jgi:hypothetical protein
LLARTSLGKESSANAKAAPAALAEVQQASKHQEQSLDEFTPPKFSWNIGNIGMSAPRDDGGPNHGENRAAGGSAWLFAGPLPWPIQAKLEVGAADDPLEQEAERVAEQVMRMPDPRASTNSTTPGSSSALQGGSPTASDATAQLQCSCGGSCDACKAEQGYDEHGKVRLGELDHRGSDRRSTLPRAGHRRL